MDSAVDRAPPGDRSAIDSQVALELPTTDAASATDRAAHDGPAAADGGSAPDRALSPCQQGWAGGWVLQGSSGVNCYGACDDDRGAFAIDCGWDGVCRCYGPGFESVCPASSCEALVNSGCCAP